MQERRTHEDQFPRASLNGEQLDEFKEIIAPLEERAGRPLGGPGRRLCLQAFEENPHGFGEVAADAWVRGDNPLALLITIVRAGEHREIVLSPEVSVVEVAEIAQEGMRLAELPRLCTHGSCGPGFCRYTFEDRRGGEAAA
jgi:hypothetical protein